MKLSVLLPAYNESENVKRFTRELVPYLDELNVDYEILLIDDGSTDRTAEIAESLGINHLRVIRHGRNRGIGTAVRTGIAHAAGDLTVMLDTDLTFYPSYIKDLLRRYETGDVDFVIGSPKLASLGSEIQWYRKFITACANLAYSILLGRNITAVTPIFRLYKTRDLKALSLEAEKFDITVEILFKLIRNGKKYAEVPAPLTTRKFGVSKLDYRKEIIRHLKMLVKILLWRLKRFTPRIYRPFAK